MSNEIKISSDVNNDNEKLYLRCPNCGRKTKGIDDYKTLIKGRDTITKTCKVCRIKSYESYKKNNIDKFKKQNKPIIDYTEEYRQHIRCPKCKKPKAGECDFKNKTGKITKTCSVCRAIVLEAVLRKERPKQPRVTMRRRINIYENILKGVDIDTINAHIDGNINEQNIIKAAICV